MLESYEAVYKNGQLKWVNEQPTTDSARVIVTIINKLDIEADAEVTNAKTTADIEPTEPTANSKTRRIPSASIAGKGKTVGDIVSPIVPEADWECLK